ncbi:MAG TPA: hypothetical protein VGJ55_17690 [Pyrinomonadaceae bacterium]
MSNQQLKLSFLSLLLYLLCCSSAFAQTTAFTYQGKLSDGGAVPTGTYEMQFKVFDVNGNQQPQPTPVTLNFTVANGNAVSVANGAFTVLLDFGAGVFPGANRFLEISVRHNSSESFVPLAPRQPINSNPYAIRSANAAAADVATNATQLGGVAANQYVVTTDSRLSDARPPTAGSLNYIQNGTSPQAGNFNISGNGTVGNNLTVNAGLNVGGNESVGGTLSAVNLTLSGALNGSGSNLTNLNAGNVSSGTLLPARGGTGLDSAGTAGNFLRSNGTNWTSSRLLAADLPAGSPDYIQNTTKTQPKASFDIGGSGHLGGALRIEANGFIDPETPSLSLSSNGSFQVDAPFLPGGRFTILPNGNVGIGNGAPDEKLDVVGNIKLTGIISGDGSGLTNVTAHTTSNLGLLGSLRWDLLGPKSFAVGTSPIGVAFDGVNIWVANKNSNNVTKLRASDGALQGTFAAGTNPQGVAFDGANIWVANAGSDNVTKLRASDGALQGTFAVGPGPQAVAFDGANIWVANYGSSSNVTKLRASDGALNAVFAVGTGPLAVAFDGVNIWVANFSSNNVTKLRASDGALKETFAVGTNPRGVAFDGATIWVANFDSNNVVKLAAFR